MTDGHDTIDELLAGYVLRSLSGEDAARADRLLAEHVPGCADCRMTLDAFGRVVADLALDAPVVEPPETLLPALHRELEPRTRRRGWNPARVGAVAAGFVLVVGLGGLAFTQFGGGSDARTLPQGDVQAALDVAMRTDATKVNLGEASEVSAPGLEAFYLLGTHVPQPPSGQVYGLWTVSGDRATFVGDFLPAASGLLMIRIELDPNTFDRVLVTTEPIGSTPSTPGDPAWQTAA